MPQHFSLETVMNMRQLGDSVAGCGKSMKNKEPTACPVRIFIDQRSFEAYTKLIDLSHTEDAAQLRDVWCLLINRIKALTVPKSI